jgi:hypothetical protein
LQRKYGAFCPAISEPSREARLRTKLIFEATDAVQIDAYRRWSAS